MRALLVLLVSIGITRPAIASVPEDEQGAWQAWADENPLTARRLAEQVLASAPDSLVGNYVLGRVLREAEGDLAKAMYHLGHARARMFVRCARVIVSCACACGRARDD